MRRGKPAAVVIIVCVAVLWSVSPAPILANIYVTSGLLLLMGVHFLINHSYRITVSNSCISEESLFGKKVLRWTQVDDVLDLPNIVVVKASGPRNVISIFRPSPENVFHKLKSLNNYDDLIGFVLDHTVPLLGTIWAAKGNERAYQMAQPSLGLLAVSLGPLIVPLLAVFVFQHGPGFNVGQEHLYLFVPFCLITIYLMWRFGLFRRRSQIVISEQGIALKNGTTNTIPWETVSLVKANAKVLGLGSIAVYSSHAPAIIIPRSVDRFSDLVLQIKARIPDKLDPSAELGLPLGN